MKLKINGGLLDDLFSAPNVVQDEGVMVLKENHWLIKSRGPSDVLMAAVMCPRDAMEEYDTRGVDKVGVRFQPIRNFIKSKSQDLEMEYTNKGQFRLSQGTTTVRITGVEPEYVSGYMSEGPSIDYAVTATGDVSPFKNFFDMADNVVGSDQFLICARDEKLYLYSFEDQNDIVEKIDWDDFDEHSIDWSKGLSSAKSAVDPQEDNAADSMFSVDVAEDIKWVEDEATLYLDNNAPAKFVFTTEEGAKISYIMAPRLSESGEPPTLPEEEREV